MKEKTLFKIAIIGILVGLPLLFYYSENINITQKDISKITSEDIDKDVKVSGIINKVVNIGNLTILEITHPETITVLVFEQNLCVKENDRIDAFGKIDEYNGKPEIIADIIRRMKG